MRVIASELKKIWSVKIIVIIAVLCVLYFFFSMYFWIESSPYKRGMNVDMAHYLTENYGTTLEQDDFEDFLNYRETLIFELNQFITSRPIFTEAGIYTFDEYINFRDDLIFRYETLTEEEQRLWLAFLNEWGQTNNNVYWIDNVGDNETYRAFNRFTSSEYIVSLYHANIIRDYSEGRTYIDSFIEHTPLNEREIRRLTEIRDSGELLSIIDDNTIYYTHKYFQNLAILVILITLILVSSLITTDRANRVNWLQYSSKQGRDILKKQFIAVLISALGTTTLFVLIFTGIFGINETKTFWNNGINSFMGFPYHWLSITYGQYCLLIIGIIYLLSIGAAAFAFILSRFSQNMIKLMFKVIPFFIAALLLSNWVLSDFLVIYIGGDVLLQLSTLGVSLLVGLVMAIFVIRREKRVELT